MPLRVALVIERLEGWRGGAETSTFQLARRLAERGCQVTLVTRSLVRASGEFELLRVPAPRGPRGLQTAGFVQRAAAATTANAFDIVHAITVCPTADVYQPRGGTIRQTVARNLALRRGQISRQLKRLANAFNLKQQVLHRLEARLLGRRQPPVVAAVSDYVARQVRQQYHLDAEQVQVIFNGVEPYEPPGPGSNRDREALQRRYNLPANTTLALVVAHNFKLKGLARLIEALPGVTGHLRVLVVGRDKPAKYRAQAARLGVADRLRFVGAADDMGEFYRGADLCIHPTYHDPCSRVVLEALSAGLPVITTRHNGAAEVMQDGVHGYVIESADDVPALGEAIGRLLDPDRRRTMAQQARTLRERISMSRHARELMQLYEQLHQRKVSK